jgi:hypothetical protein
LEVIIGGRKISLFEVLMPRKKRLIGKAGNYRRIPMSGSVPSDLFH